MRVISDSSPLHYLILIEALAILPSLFERVYIPVAVRKELLHPSAPDEVRGVFSQQPAWLLTEELTTNPRLAGLETLGIGEQEAIGLAVSSRPDELLILDDLKARALAAQYQVRFIGTLGVLDLAARKGMLNLPKSVERLLETNFYVAPNILKKLLEADNERKRSTSR